MTTVLATVVVIYLLVGVALGIHLQRRLRGGGWIIVIVMTGFIWPHTLLALHLDKERRLFWHVAANEVAVLTPHDDETNEAKTFWRGTTLTVYQKAVLVQEFRRALTVLLKSEKQDGGPTPEQRLAVSKARTRAQAILPRRILAKATEMAFAEADGGRTL